MSQVQLQATRSLAPRVERLLLTLLPRLQHLLPDAEIQHIGATAIPGAVTKGDLDVCIRVARPGFRAAAQTLGAHFAIKQPENWTEDFASFGEDVGYELPVGVQLVVRGSADDRFVFLRDHLIASPTALADYNRLKREHAADGPDAYWQAKHAFFTRILAAHPLADGPSP